MNEKIKGFRKTSLARNAAIDTVREEWGDGAGQREDIPSVHRYIDQLIEKEIF